MGEHGVRDGRRLRVHRTGPQRLLLSFLLFCWLTMPLVSSAEEPRGDPAAQVLPGEFASEHWEFTARFDSGHLLFVEFIVTNIGLGDRNAAVFGHIIPPRGKPRRFSNGRTEKYWTLSPDRLRMEVGTSLLDLHAPAYKLQVNKRNVRLELQFHPDAHPVWSNTLAPPGYALDLLALATPIEGTLWMKGMSDPIPVRGIVTATHSWTNTAGSSLVLRRIEFFSLQADCPLYGLDLTAPDGTRRRWIVVKPPDDSRYTSEHFDLSFAGELSGQREPGYAVPRTVQLKNAEIEGQIRLESRILQADPFVDLPRPFRYLVSLALDLRPRRIWTQSQFEITWHAAPRPDWARQQGAGITAVTFLNPLPTTLAKIHRFAAVR